MAGGVRYGTMSAIVVAVIWGLSFVAASMVLFKLSPVLLATVRFCIASLIFAPIIVREIARGNLPSRRDLAELMLLGCIAIRIGEVGFKIECDPIKREVKTKEALKFIGRDYRKGWDGIIT